MNEVSIEGGNFWRGSEPKATSPISALHRGEENGETRAQTLFLFLSLTLCLPPFLQRVLDELPGANWVLLQHLLCVLHHILQSADTNKMDAHNLAVCIGPTLLQLDGVPLDEQKDRIEKVGGDALVTTAPPLLSLL